MIIYFELDGVLSKSYEKIEELSNGKVKAENLSKSQLWALGKSYEDFFIEIEPCEKALFLWNKLQECGYQTAILAGIPRGVWAQPQKKQWCKKYLGENCFFVPVWNEEKYLFANKGDILIEDPRSKNAETLWKEAGGEFHSWNPNIDIASIIQNSSRGESATNA